jgi:hypothetical protein
MKRLFLCAVILVAFSMDSIAQDVDQLAVGLFVAGKGGMNIGKQDPTSESGFVVNPLSDFGLTGYIPVSNRKNYGILLDIAMSSVSFSEKRIKPTEGVVITKKFSYLTFAPSFNFSYLTFGFALGLPMGVSQKDANGNDLGTIVVSDSTFISPGVTGVVTRDLKENTQMALEIRVGTMIPVLKSATGRLNVFANAGYMLTGIYKDEFYAKFPTQSQYNPSTMSFSLGVNYVFNLTKPDEE